MADEAVRSLRTLFLLSVTVGLLWLLSWSSAVERMSLYRLTLDVHAWLLLKERMTRLDEEIPDESGLGIFSLSYKENISTVRVEDLTKPIRGPEDVTWTSRPLTVQVAWPRAGKQAITLEPESFHKSWDKGRGGARVYRVRVASPSSVPEIPFSEYRVLFFPSETPLPGSGEHNPAVVPIAENALVEEGAKGLRQLSQLAARLDHPRLWDAVALHLVGRGFRGHPSELRMNDGALASLRSESDVRSGGTEVQVVGIRLSLHSFFVAIGLVLGAIAFAMLGPVVALRESRTSPSSTTWVLAVKRGTSLPRRLLEGAVVVVSVCWSAFPLAVLSLQVVTASGIRGLDAWFLWIGAAGLVFACAVHGVASYELWLHRKATGRAGP